MTKRQLIDEIVSINHSAEPGFLAKFSDGDLDEYLRHLQRLRTPRLSGDTHRYDRYFQNIPIVTATRPSVAVTEPPRLAAVQTAAKLGRTELDPGDQLDLTVSEDAYFQASFDSRQLQDPAETPPPADLDDSPGHQDSRVEQPEDQAQEQAEAWLF